ncbi:hypothetical protein M885DRAFT_290135 [Pelagophyceae sp. CCMP2097]|nr:hypothetical protein M885DRAFT_290135 [Pelagophyceae sp. CCMP2097]
MAATAAVDALRAAKSAKVPCHARRATSASTTQSFGQSARAAQVAPNSHMVRTAQKRRILQPRQRRTGGPNRRLFWRRDPAWAWPQFARFDAFPESFVQDGLGMRIGRARGSPKKGPRLEDPDSRAPAVFDPHCVAESGHRSKSTQAPLRGRTRVKTTELGGPRMTFLGHRC